MADTHEDSEADQAPAANGKNNGNNGKASKASKEAYTEAEEGLASYMRQLLGPQMNPSHLEAGIKRANKDPAVRKLLKRIAEGSAPPGKKEKKEKKEKSQRIRNAYQVFMRDAMHNMTHRTEGDNRLKLTRVAGLWNRLPASIRADMTTRMNAIKDQVNEQVAAGTNVDPQAVIHLIQQYNEQHKLKPYDYNALMDKYGDEEAPAKSGSKPAAAAAAAASKAANGAAEGEKKRKPDDENAPREKKKKKKDKEGKAAKEEAPQVDVKPEKGSEKGEKAEKGEKKKKKKHKHKAEEGGTAAA